MAMYTEENMQADAVKDAWLNSMTSEQLEAVRNMAPEQRQALFTDYVGKHSDLSDRMTRAQNMYNEPMRDGVRAGAQFVAASPMSALANALRKGTGMYQMKQARDERDRLRDQEQQARMGYAQALLR